MLWALLVGDPARVFCVVQDQPQLEAWVGDGDADAVVSRHLNCVVEARVRAGCLHVEDTPILGSGFSGTWLGASSLSCLGNESAWVVPHAANVQDSVRADVCKCS